VSKLLPDWIGEVKQSYEGSKLAEEVKKSISEARGGQDGWEEEEGVLRKKGRLYVGTAGNARARIAQELHGTATGGHSGILASYKRTNRNFVWPGMDASLEDRLRR
jgi:hypothetical protein